MFKKIALVGASVAALAVSSAATAQDARPAETGLNEIIVTAQRRQELLTDVPLSITAVTGETLEAKGLQSLTDLRFETPGFISQSGTGYTQIFIRGIGNGIYVGADPSVATFIDDVPRVYGSLLDNFINVERVEVLKGAQGGLYGRNATGGVINVITRQPSDEEWKLNGKVSAGEYNSLDAAAYLNIPLAEGVAFAMSGMRRVRDPYLKNIAVSNPYPEGTTSFFGDPNSVAEPTPVNNADFYALEAKLKLDLTDNLTVTLAGDYADKHDADGSGWIQEEVDFNYQVYLGFAALAGLSNPIPKWRPAVRGKEAYNAIESFSYTEDYGFSGTANLELGPVDVTSITAFRWNNSNFRGDIGTAPVPLAGFFTDFNRSNFYQELRFVSAIDGPLQFLGGATYYSDEIESYVQSLFIGFPSGENSSTIKTENWSVYGQVSYDLTDDLTLTGSLRYVQETKDADFPAQTGFGATDIGTKQKKLLPSATLSYDTGDGTLYARYARGFKTGGINPLVHPSAFGGQPGSTFGPEVVDAYEVGFRASLFDRRIQLTTAAFYNDYKGVHVARAGNAANPQVTNAIFALGTARTYGAEAAVTWQVTPTVTVSGNLGYLNGKYKDAAYVGSPVVDPFDSSGNIMALAPEWQGGASVNLNQPVNDSFRIKASALYSHVGKFNYQTEEYPSLWQPSYDVVNLRVGVADIDERLGVYVFANNLFDETFTVFGSRSALGSYTTTGAPRVIGGTFEFSF